MTSNCVYVTGPKIEWHLSIWYFVSFFAKKIYNVVVYRYVMTGKLVLNDQVISNNATLISGVHTLQTNNWLHKSRWN